MVGARTAAMGLNRLIDAEIDARNPRTAVRAIPAGLIGKGMTLALHHRLPGAAAGRRRPA